MYCVYSEMIRGSKGENRSERDMQGLHERRRDGAHFECLYVPFSCDRHHRPVSAPWLIDPDSMRL